VGVWGLSALVIFLGGLSLPLACSPLSKSQRNPLAFSRPS